MADQFSKMYDVERVGGDQRQRLAEMLRANALNAPQGQMVSGWYVPPSWTQNLAQLANTAVGVFGGKSIDEERKAKTAELLRELGQGVPTEENKLARIPGIMPQQGEGQSTPTPLEQTPANQSMAKMPQYRPLTDEEKIGKVMELAQYNPYAAQIWSAQDAARQNRLTRAEERAMDREFKREQLQQQLEGRMDLARLTGAIASANRPEKNVTVLDTNTGMPFTIPQSQMQPGMTIYNPTTAKAFAEQKNKAEGQSNVAEQIQGLRNEYTTLNKNMGITSEQNRVGSNIGAWASGTPVGQFAGRILGTENATARDVIRMSRPGLMQSIVKASGMSAKQIDSNAELKLMLDQATDPSAGYEANMKALNSLEKRFAGGFQPQTPIGVPDMNAIDAEIARRKGR